MARTVTLAALRNDARGLADAEGDTNVTDAQILVWINGDIQRLWNRLAIADPDRCTQSTTINTTAGTLGYNLPADFHEIRAVDLHQGANRIPVTRWIQQERWQHRSASDSYLAAMWNGTPTHYRVMGQGIAGAEAQIRFLPDPGTNTYTVLYIEVAPLLSADGDTFDGIAGWEQWIALRVARRILRKQQRYEQDFEQEIAEIEREIDAMAGLRDAAEAPRIADVRSPRFRALTMR